MAVPRIIHPQRLDVAAFAEQAQTIEGLWPMSALARLAEVAVVADAPGDGVSWQLQGERRTRLGGDDETWLHVEADATVTMQCQRCLQPVPVRIAVDRWLRFVPGGEAEAAALDTDSEDDVLPLQRAVDAQALVEDELLLELPLVPRHDACPQPLPMSAGEEDLVAADEAEGNTDGQRPNPFAALARLKEPPKAH
jgi:uncharacterized protein